MKNKLHPSLVAAGSVIDMKDYELSEFRGDKSLCPTCEKPVLILQPADPSADGPMFFVCTCGFVGQCGVSTLRTGKKPRLQPPAHIRYQLTPDEEKVFDYLTGQGGKPRIDSTSVIAKREGWKDSKVSQLKKSIMLKLKDHV